MFTQMLLPTPVLAFMTPGWSEMMILGFIALLLFGKRLPEVARSLGQGFVEFKKGMTTIQSDVQTAVYSPPPPPASRSHSRIEDDLRPTAEKFELPAEPETSPADHTEPADTEPAHADSVPANKPDNA